MQIFIPTYRRCERQITFSQFSKQTKDNVIWVVDEKDKNKLQLITRRPDDQFWTVPTDVTSIPKKRAWLFQECGRRGVDKMCMLDDDLRFAVRKSADWSETALVPAAPDQIDDGFKLMSNLLTEFSHVGFGPRQGNNNAKEALQSSGRMMYALGYCASVVLRECELGRIETREDFDYNLQLLRKGYDNRVIHTLVVDQTYNAPGGSSEIRTLDSGNDDAELLASLHPGLVKVVEKPYKGSVPRKEVIIQWKRALGAG